MSNPDKITEILRCYRRHYTDLDRAKLLVFLPIGSAPAPSESTPYHCKCVAIISGFNLTNKKSALVLANPLFIFSNASVAKVVQPELRSFAIQTIDRSCCRAVVYDCVTESSIATVRVELNRQCQ